MALQDHHLPRMRILLACAAYPPWGKGGGPAASESIARALNEVGHDVHIVTVADKDSSEMRDGIEVRTIESPNVYWNYWVKNPTYKKIAWHALENFNPRAYVRMRNEIARLRPDVVLTISCENINVATWLAAYSLGCPRAHVIQSHFLLCWRGSMFRDGKNCETRCLQCKCTSVGKKLLSHLVDGVVAESQHMLKVHAEAGYFATARQRVIPAAVERAIAHSGPAANRSGLRIGYIGVVTPNKGVETLARAAAVLGPNAPFTYHIAGDGNPAYVQRLEAIFPEGRGTFLGWVNPADFYPQIDVLVVPSLWNEPFGRVCIEAFSHGVPVVVARSGALPEIVQPGKSGMVYEPGDHRALSVCLQQLAESRALLDRLRSGAVERAEYYTPRKLGLSFSEFLGEIRDSYAGELGGGG
jgi:glycosyltransferase involved in cell wall biosynthesis